MLDFKKFEVLTFDCYGTLIDWESGILSALRPVLTGRGLNLTDSQILELYAELESNAEKGAYTKYRYILQNVMRELGKRLKFSPSEKVLKCLEESLKNWKPFSDTVDALRALKSKYKLAILSNIDSDLFSYSAEHLKIDFDWLITAEQVEAYKPSLENFNYAIKRIGHPKGELLHVAQSIYHDIVPAKKIGLTTVWVNRRKGLGGFGATPTAKERPDLEVPDLKTLVSTIGLKIH